MIRRHLTLFVALCSLVLMPGVCAYGQIISTQTAMQLELRQANIDRVNSGLARQDVRDALMRHGVDARSAAERVGSMTDAELEMLAARFDELPVGGTGVIEVVGVVAVVLIVLELLGVTDVFTRI